MSLGTVRVDRHAFLYFIAKIDSLILLQQNLFDLCSFAYMVG